MIKVNRIYFNIMSNFLVLFITMFSAYGQSQKTNGNLEYLINYLPKNYVEDGSVDYTEYLQKGLDENLNVQFPNFPLLVNETGLNIISNQILNFSQNSKLIMKTNAEERYGILNIKYVKNVIVNNPNLIGDKEKHLGNRGEWGMGINIWASKDVTINNPRISETWGDGIYIGEPPVQEKQKKKLKSYANHNIAINGGVIDDCLRNGISITSGINVLIDGVTIQNINTKAPRGAIDIEPNNKNNEIKNIVLRNITTKNNFNGLIIYLVKLAQEKKYDIGEIIIENHRDYSSRSSLTIRNYHKKHHDNKDIQGVAGKIKIKDNSYFGTKNVYNHHPDIKFNPIIEFSNIKYYKQKRGKYVIDNKANNVFRERVSKDSNVRIIK